MLDKRPPGCFHNLPARAIPAQRLAERGKRGDE